MDQQGLDRIKTIAEDICKREECRLYDLEFAGQGKQRVLRVFIDKECKNGVSLEDCSNVSQGLSLQLDVEDLVPGENYNLEVSSPGLNRKLIEPWHFQTAVEKNVRVWFKRPLLDILDATEFEEALSELEEKWKKCRRIESVLLAAEAEKIELKTDGHVVSIPYGEIEKAQVFVNLFETTKPGANNKNKRQKKKKR